MMRQIGRNVMRHLLLAASLLLGSVNSAGAQVSVGIGIGFPSVDIGIQVPVYPDLVAVPGYPVYYDPRADSNYFFYDGVYWVYVNDNWYASSWYNGPWRVVRPEHVPLYVLRVPVRYYRRPPPYFRGWHPDGPPRWGQHWGPGWERHRRGWDRWDRRAVPRAAPLPVYQREYAGDRYPHAVEQQHSLGAQHYQYRPREAAAREYFPPRAYQQSGGPPGPRAEPPGQRGYPAGPRAEPMRPAPGPQQGPGPQQPPPDRGRSRGHGPGDERHDGRHEDRGHGPR
jgi:hypothetical protein